MNNVSINGENVENTVSELVSKIKTEVIEASAASRDTIIEAIENSSGDLIDSLKIEVANEADILSSVGELLIATANYVQSAAGAFLGVDAAHASSQIAN